MDFKMNFKMNVDTVKHGARIDHLGIACKSLERSRKLYEMLGLKVTDEETIEQERVRIAMVQMGESRIELLEPIGQDSVISKFIAKRGEGLHHVALHVEGLDALVAQLKSNGVKLVKDEVQIGASGHRYVFIHPSSAGGVLLELCE